MNERYDVMSADAVTVLRLFSVMDAMRIWPTDEESKRYRNAVKAVASLIDAIKQDAVDKAVASGLGASEWRAFLSPRESSAIAKIGETK